MIPPASARSISSLVELIRSGIRPDRATAWYDRLIRILGGVIFLAVFVAGLILAIRDKFFR